MYDCSKEFNEFYRTRVVLSETDQSELREKRKLNIKRLREGLLDYNDEKGKDYKIAEDRIQGSMAMHTIVQNDKNDYDIDAGIVFESDNLNGRSTCHKEHATRTYTYVSSFFVQERRHMGKLEELEELTKSMKGKQRQREDLSRPSVRMRNMQHL